ncbi:hypothetical protein [Acidipila rosea]|uniref:Uncharacterized protein n=1 Tax=Acidipila rosea TaxID=768535 RepID=A0A4R1L3A0_9BACT|nr:hypothetical protein [Acidipila rosea]TCK72454.1 hypothetical protein C7378_2031 [Acidipila rosea]
MIKDVIIHIMQDEIEPPMPPESAPRKGDVLFRGDLPDWHNNACLSGTSQGDPVAYVEGYRRGAEILVRFVNDNGRDQDFLVYPILFLYRHHLELAMKRIIRRLPRLLYRELTSNETGQLRQHSLTGLWQALKPMVASIYKAVDWPDAKSEDIAGADDYVRQLSAIDPDSESFRYPFGKSGKANMPEGLIRLNIRHFAVTISRLVQYIDDIDTATSVVGEWQDDMEADGAP